MKVGILGGGQLARMMALAGHNLGIQTIVLDPTENVCSNDVATHLHGNFNNNSLLKLLAEQTDVITYEFENVPADCVELLQQQNANVHPNPKALATAQDRLVEKNLFKSLGIDTPPFAQVDNLPDLKKAADEIGLPAVLKTRRLGYDGKGQFVIRNESQLQDAWTAICEAPAILEAFIPFDREISVIAVRDQQGEILTYPLSENVHRNGILHTSRSLHDDPMQGAANAYAEKLMAHLDYVGVLAIELFQSGDKLLGNEFAPRVHNSGHWTIEGAETSQFENHLRAILGLSLGSTDAVEEVTMINCIGSMPEKSAALKITGAHLHDYNKEPREGRKVGHITIRHASREIVDQRTQESLKLFR